MVGQRLRTPIQYCPLFLRSDCLRIYIASSFKDNVLLKYRDLATEVADALAKEGHKLVFGGYDTGMMGKTYMAFKYESARTKAIVDIKNTDILSSLEVDAYDVTTNAMQRIEKAYKSSQVCLILPGGIETLAEFFTFVDEVRMHKSDVRIILFNYEHFFSPIINFLKNAYKENFVSERELKLFDIVTDINSLNLYLYNLEKRLKEDD